MTISECDLLSSFNVFKQIPIAKKTLHIPYIKAECIWNAKTFKKLL